MDWISVKERLPEIDGTYLIFNTYGGMMVWNYIGKQWKKYGFGQVVTHWMPLPEPPKEQH